MPACLERRLGTELGSVLDKASVKLGLERGSPVRDLSTPQRHIREG